MNALTKKIWDSSSHISAKNLAVSFSLADFEVALKEIQDPNVCRVYVHWKFLNIAEGFALSLEMNKVPAQKRVVAYLKAVDKINEKTLTQLFHGKTIKTMKSKGMFSYTDECSMGEIPGENYYWTDVRLSPTGLAT